MYAAFEKLPEEKKQHILKSCLAEFVKNGYERASTDAMVSRAGISKGSLFHYFKNKRNLYLFLANYIMEFLKKESMAQLMQVEANDFFERIKAVYLVKQKVAFQYYSESQFILQFLTHPPHAVAQESEELLKKFKQFAYEDSALMDQVYRLSLLHTDELRDGVSAERVVEMIMMLIEQMSNKYMALLKGNRYDYFNEQELMTKELNDYLELIKHGVYKPK